MNEIRKLINIEEKVLEAALTSTSFDTTGFVTPVSQLVQGLDYTNRVGDSIRMQRIVFNYRVVKNSSATSSVVRIMLIRDLDCAGATPSTSDILQTVGGAGAPLTFPDYLNRNRFSILHDRLEIVSTSDLAFTGTLDMPHQGHILYLGTAANAASQGKGSMFVVAVSDEATNTPTLAFQTRIVFTDD